MRREFEELGLTIGGVGYGHFTGAVQFDETGAPVIIDIETANFGGSPLLLEIEALVRERIALQHKLGTSAWSSWLMSTQAFAFSHRGFRLQQPDRVQNIDHFGRVKQ